MSSSQSDTDDNHEVFLESTWTLFFHDPENKDWTNESYSRITTISSANEFWGVQSMLEKDARISKGMFFFMRDDVFPCWDDSSNIDGGCLSFMVPRNQVADAWMKACARMMSHCITPSADDNYKINGISVSPKNDFCILKLWMADTSITDVQMLNIPELGSKSMFVANRDKIAGK